MKINATALNISLEVERNLNKQRCRLIAGTRGIGACMRHLGKVLILALWLAVPGTAQAGQLQLFAGAWLYHANGELNDQGDTFDLQSDLHVRRQNPLALGLRYRPQLGWLPELSADYQRISATGNGVVTASRSFGPLTFAANSPVAAQVGITDADAALDVPFRLLGVHWALGLMVKYIGGHAVIVDQTTGQRSDYSINRTFPMAHLRARVALAPWLDLQGEGALVYLEGDRASEFRVEAVARLGPVGVSAGYQEMHFLTRGDGYQLNARLRGPRLGLQLAF